MNFTPILFFTLHWYILTFTVNEMGSQIPLSAHFIVPVIRSVLSWWWPTCGRNM